MKFGEITTILKHFGFINAKLILLNKTLRISMCATFRAAHSIGYYIMVSFVWVSRNVFICEMPIWRLLLLFLFKLQNDNNVIVLNIIIFSYNDGEN